MKNEARMMRPLLTVLALVGTSVTTRAAWANVVCSPAATDAVTAAYYRAVEQSHLTDDDKKEYCGHEPHSFHKNYVVRKDVAVLLYDELGTPIGKLPQVDEDDEVLVAVAAGPASPNTVVESLIVSTCSAPDLVRVGGGGGGVVPAAIPGAPAPLIPLKDRYKVSWLTDCSGDDGIKLTVTSSTGVGAAKVQSTRTLAIPTLPLYRLTVGVGVIDDFTQRTTFSAKNVKGENVPVIVANRENEGLAVVGFVSLHVSAVDLSRKRPFYQWFSPVLGVSLTHPTDHIYFGLGIDPVPGLGALVGWHALRSETLAGGYEENDRVPDGVVMTDKRWQKLELDDMFIGVNFDALVLAKVVAGLGSAQ